MYVWPTLSHSDLMGWCVTSPAAQIFWDAPLKCNGAESPAWPLIPGSPGALALSETIQLAQLKGTVAINQPWGREQNRCPSRSHFDLSGCRPGQAYGPFTPDDGHGTHLFVHDTKTRPIRSDRRVEVLNKPKPTPQGTGFLTGGRGDSLQPYKAFMKTPKNWGSRYWLNLWEEAVVTYNSSWGPELRMARGMTPSWKGTCIRWWLVKCGWAAGIAETKWWSPRYVWDGWNVFKMELYLSILVYLNPLRVFNCMYACFEVPECSLWQLMLTSDSWDPRALFCNISH